MKNIITVMKKELYRFFSDKRLLFTVVLMPGLMIYIMYSIMGEAMGSMMEVEDDYKTSAYILNMPESFKASFEAMNIEKQDTGLLELEEMKENISSQIIDLLVIFPENFETAIIEYDSTTAAAKAPQVEIYYNASKTESSSGYSMVRSMLDTFESTMINKFDINSDTDVKYNLASDKDITSQIFSSLFPMLLITFIFSACVSIAPESIAGEKERGTLTTVLVTPIKRAHLAVGKIIALSFLALLSGTSSFLGTALSLPKIMNGASGKESVDANVYSIQDYILLFFIVLCTVLLIIALISVISAFAKNVKEATSYTSPIMILSMVIALTTMFGDGAAQHYLYLIPVYNSVQCMASVFQFSIDVANVMITVGSNLVYSVIFVFILTKMFNSEKMMLS